MTKDWGDLCSVAGQGQLMLQQKIDCSGWLLTRDEWHFLVEAFGGREAAAKRFLKETPACPECGVPTMHRRTQGGVRYFSCVKNHEFTVTTQESYAPLNYSLMVVKRPLNVGDKCDTNGFNLFSLGNSLLSAGVNDSDDVARRVYAIVTKKLRGELSSNASAKKSIHVDSILLGQIILAELYQRSNPVAMFRYAAHFFRFSRVPRLKDDIEEIGTELMSLWRNSAQAAHSLYADKSNSQENLRLLRLITPRINAWNWELSFVKAPFEVPTEAKKISRKLKECIVRKSSGQFQEFSPEKIFLGLVFATMGAASSTECLEWTREVCNKLDHQILNGRLSSSAIGDVTMNVLAAHKEALFWLRFYLKFNKNISGGAEKIISSAVDDWKNSTSFNGYGRESRD